MKGEKDKKTGKNGAVIYVIVSAYVPDDRMR